MTKYFAELAKLFGREVSKNSAIKQGLEKFLLEGGGLDDRGVGKVHDYILDFVERILPSRDAMYAHNSHAFNIENHVYRGEKAKSRTRNLYEWLVPKYATYDPREEVDQMFREISRGDYSEFDLLFGKNEVEGITQGQAYADTLGQLRQSGVSGEEMVEHFYQAFKANGDLWFYGGRADTYDRLTSIVGAPVEILLAPTIIGSIVVVGIEEGLEMLLGKGQFLSALNDIKQSRGLARSLLNGEILSLIPGIGDFIDILSNSYMTAAKRVVREHAVRSILNQYLQAPEPEPEPQPHDDFNAMNNLPPLGSVPIRSQTQHQGGPPGIDPNAGARVTVTQTTTQSLEYEVMPREESSEIIDVDSRELDNSTALIDLPMNKE